MGNSAAKENDVDAELAKDTDVQVFWDVNGILRKQPLLAKHNPARELQLVKKIEMQDASWSPGQVFYLIHTQWLEGWLQYVRTNGTGAPQPASVSNDQLLAQAEKDGPVTLKPGLRTPRNYRLLREQVWTFYSQLYKVKGAVITVTAPSELDAELMLERHLAALDEKENEEKHSDEKSSLKGEKKGSEAGDGSEFKVYNPLLLTGPAHQLNGSESIDGALEIEYDPYKDFMWDKLAHLADHAVVDLVDEEGKQNEEDDVFA